MNAQYNTSHLLLIGKCEIDAKHRTAESCELIVTKLDGFRD